MRKGQCLCAAVRFTADEIEPDAGACHCRMCQRWSGAVFITVTARGVRFEGEEHIGTYRASKWAERGFCSKCGSHLFYRFLDNDEYEICVGVLDDQSDFVLSGEIFVDRKPAGFALAGEHLRLTEAETLAKFPIFGS